MDYPKHIVATSALIQNKNNQILLVKTELRGWEMPGGQVEEGEDLMSALEREVLEEAGATIKIKKLSAIYSSISKPSKVIVDFVADYESGEIKGANEIKYAQWFSKEDAVSNVTSEPIKYRLEWLLKNNDKVRFASYSKNPFKVISELY